MHVRYHEVDDELDVRVLMAHNASVTGGAVDPSTPVSLGEHGAPLFILLAVAPGIGRGGAEPTAAGPADYLSVWNRPGPKRDGCLLGAALAEIGSFHVPRLRSVQRVQVGLRRHADNDSLGNAGSESPDDAASGCSRVDVEHAHFSNHALDPHFESARRIPERCDRAPRLHPCTEADRLVDGDLRPSGILYPEERKEAA